MRVAIPLFDKDVAPRFGFADAYLVATVEEKNVVSTECLQSIACGWPERMTQLKLLGIEVLLCGGFNRKFLPLAEDIGIRVYAGLAGDARQCVQAFASGEQMPELFCDGFSSWGRPPALWQDRCKGDGRRLRDPRCRNS